MLKFLISIHWWCLFLVNQWYKLLFKHSTLSHLSISLWWTMKNLHFQGKDVNTLYNLRSFCLLSRMFKAINNTCYRKLRLIQLLQIIVLLYVLIDLVQQRICHATFVTFILHRIRFYSNDAQLCFRSIKYNSMQLFLCVYRKMFELCLKI